MWIRIAKTPFLAWDRRYDRDGHYASLSGAGGPTAAAGYVQDPGVYGIRRLSLDEIRHSILAEYNASRLHPEDVRALLRSAGLDTDGVAEGVFDAG
jgi:hypothetical protein